MIKDVKKNVKDVYFLLENDIFVVESVIKVLGLIKIIIIIFCDEKTFIVFMIYFLKEMLI